MSRTHPVAHRRSGPFLAKFLCLVAVVQGFVPGVRYAYYLSPLIALSATRGNRLTLVLSRPQLIMSTVLLILFCLAFLSSSQLTFVGLRDFLIAIEVLLLLTASVSCSDRNVLIIVYSFLVAAFLENAFSPDGLHLAFDFEQSVGPLEFSYAFPTGAAFLFFLYKRNWSYALITFVVSVLMFKRFVLIGTPLIGLANVLSSSWRPLHTFWGRFYIMLAIFLLGFCCKRLQHCHNGVLGKYARIYWFLKRNHDGPPIFMVDFAPTLRRLFHPAKAIWCGAWIERRVDGCRASRIS